MSIDNVYNLGADSLLNEFEIILPTFPGAIDLGSTVLRVTKFGVPGLEVSTYDIQYKTQKMTRPAGKNATVNNFTFDFRVDKYWKVYEGFENWINLILNQDTGAMGLDGIVGTPSSIRIPIDVIPVDANGTVTKKGWTFIGCFPSTLTGIDFTQDSGEPVTATVTMQFVKRLLRS